MKQKIVIISQDGYVAETAGIMAGNGTAEIIDARGGLENACAETVMSKADALMFEGNISDAELAERIFESLGVSPAVFVFAGDDRMLSQLKRRSSALCIPLGKSSDASESARFVTANLMIRTAGHIRAEHRTLNAYVSRVLMDGSIKPSYFGFRLLRDAIVYCVEKRSSAALGKEVYGELAKSYSTTAAAVERNIRTTIERCWELNPEDFCAGFFGSPCTAMRQRPTAKEFISTVAEKISLEMG